MQESGRFKHLTARLLQSGIPAGVAVAQQAKKERLAEPLLNYPRLSVCLTRQADYGVARDGGMQEIRLYRHQALFHAPGCHSYALDPAAYISLGVVFHEQMTLYLLAKKRPAWPNDSGHRFICQHQVSAVLDDDGRAICRAVVHAAHRPREDAYLCSLIRLLLIRAHELLDEAPPQAMASSSRGLFSWQAACHFIQEHHRQPIGRQDVAEFLRMHPNHVSRLFKQFGSRTFNQYLTDVRLKRAMELLRDPCRSVSEVAYLSGFSSPNYFVWSYRRAFGRSPGQDRLSRGVSGSARESTASG